MDINVFVDQLIMILQLLVFHVTLRVLLVLDLHLMNVHLAKLLKEVRLEINVFA